ncbi:hypothetical protein MP228_003158 [Amoeboaphelidium protococcarum]|nr:hypothetical protein MP228_003158 [Amoeboaphelidium protococcarum]
MDQNTDTPHKWQSFRDVAWLQTYGLGAVNALDYFATSQFYDPTCNNEVVKMQTKFNNLAEMGDMMIRMVGVEYVLAHVQEPILYVIRKQKRKSEIEVELLETYYILEGTVYMAPSLKDVITSRLMHCSQSLQSMVQLIQQKSVFSLQDGFRWIAEDQSQLQDSPLSDVNLSQNGQDSNLKQLLSQRITQRLSMKLYDLNNNQ